MIKKPHTSLVSWRKFERVKKQAKSVRVMVPYGGSDYGKHFVPFVDGAKFFATNAIKAGAQFYLITLLDGKSVPIRIHEDALHYHRIKLLDGACGCHSCGEAFTVDLDLPDELWEKVYTESPEKAKQGGGLLCPGCISKRLTENKTHLSLHFR